MIFNSSRNEFEAFDQFISFLYKDEVDATRKIINSFRDRTDIKFYLRVHPNLKNLNMLVYHWYILSSIASWLVNS